MPSIEATCHLEIRDLHRSFGRLTVLRGVSAEVSAGQVLLVTGANGCGKSTLLKCLAGLLAEDSGRILYRENGLELDRSSRRQALGYAAPDVFFYGELTVAENLRFFSRLRHLPPDQGLHLVERVGLPPDRLAAALSSGMMQRLRLCYALLHEPRLLLLDEPFQNLDAPGCEAVSRLVAEHLRRGVAVIANPGPLDLHLNLDLDADHEIRPLVLAG
jgi:ABC-type multidrug transport system ATPase subunit